MPALVAVESLLAAPTRAPALHLPPCVEVLPVEAEGWLPADARRWSRRAYRATVAVDDGILRRALGRAGWAAWLLLLAHRDPRTLECWLGAERLAATDPSGIPGLDDAMPPSARRVQRGITRLRAAGLVESEPAVWHERHVGEGRMEPRHVRIVLGVHGREGQSLVPVRVAAWLRGHPSAGWGGARVGAGRPSRSRIQVVAQVTSEGRAEGRLDEIKMGNNNISSNLIIEGDCGSPPPSGESSRATLRADVGLAASLDDFLPGPTVPADEALVVRDSDHLPPYPDTRTTGRPLVPAPACIPAEASDRRAVDLLVQAYRGAVRARFGRKSGTVFDRHRDPTKSGHYDMLVAAGRLLRDHEIAPVAWATWSVDAWLSMHDEEPKPGKRVKKLRPPPVAWVYLATRIEEREGWFRSESGGYESPRAVLLPADRDLFIRYTALAHAPVEARPALLARLFPRGWAVALTEVRRLNEIRQREINVLVARDGWVWL